MTDPCAEKASIRDRNLFTACYALSLALGETLLWKHITSKTINHYIKDMDKLFEERGIPYRYDHDPLSVILKALDDYEKVPNRRHMITDEMMHYMRKQIKDQPPDGLTKALFDWIVLGRYTGFRRSEWCQTTKTKYETLDEWPGQPAKAFIKTDFVFLTRTKRRLTGRVSQIRKRAHYVRITWRYQKNGDHNQDITFARDLVLKDFCPVEAALNIVARAERLKVPSTDPIAVYKNASNARTFITDTDVNALLRNTAQNVLNIPANNPELERWSTHSVQVTAANLLHRQKFSDSYIQNRLRWKRDAFKVYLRNTFYTADQHTLYLSDENLPPVDERSTREDEPHELVMASLNPSMPN